MSTATPVPGTTARRLGEQERIFHYLHGYGGLIAVQVLHLEGPLAVEDVRAALADVQRRHALLGVHIVYREPVYRSRPPWYYRQPWFEREGTTAIPLTVVTDSNPNAWNDILARELMTPLAVGNTPRARATLVRTHEGATTHQLVLTLDHAVSDAQATNLISRDLLNFLADPRAAGEPLPTPELPEPLEARLPRQTAPEGAYIPAQRIPTRLSKAPMTPHMVRRKLTPDETERLRAATRANRSTMHGAVSAAFHVAFRDKYAVTAMTQISSVDLRRLCKPAFPAATFGCYIDLMRTAHQLTGGFWDIARDVSFKLITTLARDREGASLMKLPGWEIYAKEAVPTMRSRRRLDGVGITTAGESGLETRYGALTLTDVTMMVSTVMFGPSLFVITAERLGALDIYAGYAADALEDADASDILDRVTAALRSASA